MKILHLPSSTGNNAYNLSIGEKLNGADSTVLIDDPCVYDYKADMVFNRFKNRYLNRLSMLIYCLKNASKYDVFHYNFGQALIGSKHRLLAPIYGIDVIFFKKLGKVIAVTYQGSDARQVDYCRKNYDPQFYSHVDMQKEKKSDEKKRQRISFWKKHADLIYAINPDLLNVLPDNAKFRPYTKLQLSEWKPCYSDYKKKHTVILHSPTNREIKGTKYVDEAIIRLQNEGYDIEYSLLQNVPNDQAIEYYKSADLVIDQLQVGWYGGLAVECMALGKPVMCYIRESDMKYIPNEMNDEMPIIRVTKDTLYECLKDKLNHKEQLSELAYRSRRYIEKWHDPKEIAKGILTDYQTAMEKL